MSEAKDKKEQTRPLSYKLVSGVEWAMVYSFCLFAGLSFINGL